MKTLFVLQHFSNKDQFRSPLGYAVSLAACQTFFTLSDAERHLGLLSSPSFWRVASYTISEVIPVETYYVENAEGRIKYYNSYEEACQALTEEKAKLDRKISELTQLRDSLSVKVDD